ncbi:MAG: glycosyltransferase family 2 protein [archaeon]|nr:glycosyltransferase family 2 protein [archaeon]MCP8314409.1 glycosyltransferase family 2 protein [archaeon]MCP8317284.1 glycosyltransferase family 2 protein [archaeon]MCP8319808.1 glycosyltransferase family 2 protein [archaeon]
MNAPKVSVIIVNHNDGAYLQGCLQSVFNNDYPLFEVILVDNGSTDNSLELVKQFLPQEARLKIVPLKKNYGFAMGNNIGVANCSNESELLVFLNADTIVDKRWLIELIRAMEDEAVGVAAPKILSMSRPNILDCAGCLIDELGYPIERRRGLPDSGLFDNSKEILYAKGASLMVRKKLFKLLRGFDDSFFIYYEETDLCWKIWLMGLKVVYTPKSVIYHDYERAFKRKADNPKKDGKVAYLMERNRLMTMTQNMEASTLLKCLPLAFAVLMGSMVIDIFRKKPSCFKAKFYASCSIVQNLPQIIRKRRFVQRVLRRIDDKDLFSRSIIRRHRFLCYTHQSVVA